MSTAGIRVFTKSTAIYAVSCESLVIPTPDPRPGWGALAPRGAETADGGWKKILGCWRIALQPANTPNPDLVKTRRLA